MGYESPMLRRYGKVAQLTLGGTKTNQDVPFGVSPNTAYPPFVPPPPGS